MNIKLLKTLPMDSRHGMTAGRVLKVADPSEQPELADRLAIDCYFVVTDLSVLAMIERNEAVETDEVVTE